MFIVAKQPSSLCNNDSLSSESKCRSQQNYSRMIFFPLLLLLFATTITSWIPSNRKMLQHIRTTHVPLISSGRWTDTNRCTPSYTAFCGSNSDNSDVDYPLQEVQQKIRAVEYCLDNFGNITIPDNADKAFIQLIRRYKKFKVEDDLVGMLKDLQGEKTKLLPSNAAAVSKGMNDYQGDSINYAYFILLCHAFQQMIPNYATNKKQRYVESGIGFEACVSCSVTHLISCQMFPPSQVQRLQRASSYCRLMCSPTGATNTGRYSQRSMQR